MVAPGEQYQYELPLAPNCPSGTFWIHPHMHGAVARQVWRGRGLAMTWKEVGPVMKALQDNGVQATALHSHALNDVPRLLYMHFWANDDAVKLAKTLRSALDKTNSKKGQ
jgi:hypothetical protein